MTYQEVNKLSPGTILYWARFYPDPELKRIAIVKCEVDDAMNPGRLTVTYQDTQFKNTTVACPDVKYVFKTQQEAVTNLRTRLDSYIIKLTELKDRFV